MTDTFERLTEIAWKAPGTTVFTAMRAVIETRFGPPAARDEDSNGLGLFDAHVLRFACGLEVSLWRYHYHHSYEGHRVIDPEREPSTYELRVNRPGDDAHAMFHLGIPKDQAHLHSWQPADPSHAIKSVPATIVVMRADDNGNQVEVTRVTSRCEAEAIVAEYEARAHKQTYWIAQ